MAKQSALSALGQGGMPELWVRLRFLFLAIIVYRIGAHIPVPGINPNQLVDLFRHNEGTILSLFNMFSGGALERMSIFAMGIMPYVSASIIMQLMIAASPQLEQLKKEGEAGRCKINLYTRYGAVVLALIQAISISIGLVEHEVTLTHDFGFYFIAVSTFVAGSMFMMWLGEQITERGIGNGISMLIFAGIVAGLPKAIGQSFESARQGDINIIALIIIGFLAVVIIGFVVFIERGQRRIVVHYARRQQGRKVFAAQTSHLPLKVNMAGVIPAIFASSILLFPASLGTWFGQSENMYWLQGLVQLIAPGQPLNVLLFSVGIIFFCFFYTALIFNPKDVAENLKKSGAFIPGIRPGEQSARYINVVLTRLTLFGALYIMVVCLLPQFLVVAANVPFYLGGTSLLIVVVVVMDFMSQVQSHLFSHQYESLIKKANLKSCSSSMFY
ncbi:preprotein translocase subunit SecY [Candidatus Pseudomonas adelgestsugas]|uniref:Protein translocase subunit SecY n=1 Tax=Candidatus Pseudomonas adelgestsugas TaxID=1302376 RepID=A0ABX5R896_9PSED|nr:preprotein translocase subunit SecY [Candidatus Pseudomonas adelgestsugas]QAX81652.1 preprotein translocase subunit SecY [Candidatus Pseudomonas adelgestsugas]